MSDAGQFVVHKFGGTSVGNAACFAKVTDIVAALAEPRVAVVVSAIGGKPKVTDLLISLLELAKLRKTAEIDGILSSIREKHRAVIAALLPPLQGEEEDEGARIEREIAADLARISELLRAISIMQIYTDNVVEFVSGHGEIWSAKVLAAVLSRRARRDNQPYRYRFVDARDFLTVEMDEDRGPIVLYDQSEAKMQAILAAEPAGTRLVITGFICSTRDGVMTTLKRDGSDFTASICGRVLHASSVTIWTDVSGVLSSDPRRVPESKILPEISYEEAMELAYFGAKVIHPKTMSPMIAEDIPIFIRNTFEPEHPGTKISNRKRVELTRTLSNGARTARNIVSGFSTVDDLALFNIEGSGMVGVHGTSSRLFSALDRIKVNVVLIAQASSEHSICFAVPMNRAEDTKEMVDETFFKEIHVGSIDKTEYIAPISIIAAVGDNMNATPGVCARFFGALGRAKINVLAISQGSSERNISAVVHYKDSAAALRAVHSSFFLSDQTISVGIVGLELSDEKGEDEDIGRALLAQFHQQRDYLTQRFNVDIRLRAVATHSSERMLLDVNGGLTSEDLAPGNAEWQAFDHAAFLDHVCADHLPHWLIIDVSDCPAHVEQLYPSWLSRKVHLITSNINVGAASSSLFDALRAKTIENELTFDPEACLSIGVPIFNTIQNFVQTGDEIVRVEYSGSRFLHAVLDAVMAQPKPAEADLAAVMKAQMDVYRREFSVREILDDVTGVRSAKKAVLIARELGFATELKAADITSDWLVDDEAVDVGKWSYEQLLTHLVDKSAALREQIAAAVRDAQVVRLMTHIDAMPTDPRKIVSVRLERLPVAHAFAALRDGMQGAFAFYTRRHARHPVVVSGPIADKAITAGTLFGSTLNLARICGARDSGK